MTILDVARLANVSRATASRALGGYGRIGAQTRERVLAAAAQLEYRPNELARAVRAGRSRTIGLVVAEIGNSFHDAATKAIVETAASAGYQVLVANTNEQPHAERRAVRVLAEKRVDGLVVIPCSATGNEHLLLGGHPIAPMVLLDRRLAGVEIGSVTTDDRASAATAVRHLLDRGHRDIGALIGSPRVDRVTATPSDAVISTGRDRTLGVAEQLARAGLPSRRDLVRYSPPEHGVLVAAAAELLMLPRPPSALITANTDVALAVAQACRRTGRRLGVELSLISFDDAPWAALFTPALTVLSRPVYELGQAAVRLLVEQLQDRSTPARSLVLPTRLIERDSVATIGPPLGQRRPE